MKLTPFAKGFIAVVVLSALDIRRGNYKGEAIKQWAGGDRPAEGVTRKATSIS